MRWQAELDGVSHLVEVRKEGNFFFVLLSHDVNMLCWKLYIAQLLRILRDDAEMVLHASRSRLDMKLPFSYTR